MNTQGTVGSYEGTRAVFMRQQGNMVEVKIAGGTFCIDAADFIVSNDIRASAYIGRTGMKLHPVIKLDGKGPWMFQCHCPGTQHGSAKIRAVLNFNSTCGL